MDSQKFFALGLALLVTGCASRLQEQVVGRSGVVFPTARAGTPPVTTVQVPVPPSDGSLQLRYALSLPRAVKLRFQIGCPTAQRTGIVGETFSAYRARRLAELERERRAQVGLIGAVVGRMLPPVGGQVMGGAPGSPGLGVRVDPRGAAVAVADQALPPPQLSSADTGAQQVSGTILLEASAAGVCAVAVWPDPPDQDASGAQLSLELIRVVDIAAQTRARDQQKQQRLAAAAQEAQRQRREVAQRAQDERLAQEREQARVAAEARARREAEARRREQEARAPLLAIRQLIVARLLTLGADPLARGRAQAKVDQERWRREAAAEAERARGQQAEQQVHEQRLRQQQAVNQQRQQERQREEADRRARARDERARGLALRGVVLVGLIQAGADPDHRRQRSEALLREQQNEARHREQAIREAAERARRETEAAATLRMAARLWLHRQGAVDRPPRPPAPAETPPPPPFAGAVWMAGRYEWNGAAWFWIGGAYRARPRPGLIWFAPVEISIGGPLLVQPARQPGRP